MKSPQKREARKDKKPLPTLEELNFPNHRKLSRPKKSNKQALKRIARGDIFWDHRKIERLGQRYHNRYRRTSPFHVSLAKHKMSPAILKQIVEMLTLWNWNEETESFQTISQNETVSKAELNEVIVAAHEIPYESIPIRIDGLTENQYKVIDAALPWGSALGGTKIESDEVELTYEQSSRIIYHAINDKEKLFRKRKKK